MNTLRRLPALPVRNALVAALVAGVLLIAHPAGLASATTPGADTPGVSAPAESPRAVIPTSVLIVADETGASAALHSLDRAYAELSALVKPDRDAYPSLRPATGRPVGPTVTVSWLLHDSRVWRVDRIYYEAPDGPWIATDLRIGGVDDESHTEWHTSNDADRLLGVLEELGVLGGPGAVVSAGADEGAEAATSPWVWAAGGLMSGVALAVLGLYLAGRGRRRDTEPRQQLIDL